MNKYIATLAIAFFSISSSFGSESSLVDPDKSLDVDCKYEHCPDGLKGMPTEHTAHEGMAPKAMDHSAHEGMVPKAMDHSAHEAMAPKAMDHSAHEGMMPKAMDHSAHEAMSTEIPVSDGSAPMEIPMPYPSAMHMEDDPIVSKVIIDQFEVRNADEGDDPIVFEAEAWVGKDLNKIWIKADVEQVGSEIEEAQLDLLYSRAVSPYWDVQIGARSDLKPEQENWFALGVKGLAPYFFEVDTTLYMDKDGQTELSATGEYEMMLSQKAVLSPELGLTLYGKDDEDTGRGSGLSNTSLGLRLRYEIRREFAPYVGVVWSKFYRKTADFRESEGEDIDDTTFVVGIRAWF